MSHHKWGIWWMALLAWNASNFGGDLWRGRYWWTLASGLAVIWCAAMAYRNLTMRTAPRDITITIRKAKP